MKRRESNFPISRLTRSLADVKAQKNSSLEMDHSSGLRPVFYQKELRYKIKRRLIVPTGLQAHKTVKSKVMGEVSRREFLKRDYIPQEPITPKYEPQNGRISVVIPFRGIDHLGGVKECIRTIREQMVNYHIILVEQDHAPLFRNELEPLVDHYLFTYSGNLFNKSWAMNCGVMLAPDELILLHDCDILIPQNYIQESVQLLGNHDMALPWGKLHFLDAESSRHYPREPINILYTHYNHNVCGGSLLVYKRFYLDIGGFDERFEGWGYEDRAFFDKACRMGDVVKADMQSGPTILHYYHARAPMNHHHYDTNGNMLAEYHRESAQEIRQKVSGLGPIGSSSKYRAN